jgi:hypothetical protein
MALLDNLPKFARWIRPAKAKFEGTNYGASWIHWEPPKIRENDGRLRTPVDEDNKEVVAKRRRDMIRGKW